MVAEGHYSPEDRVMPTLQEQSYNKEHKASKQQEERKSNYQDT